MYSDMTCEQLIEELLVANDEIVRLKAENRRLADDLDTAERERDEWEEQYDALQDGIDRTGSVVEQAERRRLAEWNAWAQQATAQ